MKEIAEIAEILHGEGMRLTGPRRRLLEVFAGTQGVVKPQDLYRQMEGMVGEATVYRLLQALYRLGKARRYVVGEGEVGYLYCGGQHHHHAICLACGKVKEIPCPLIHLPEADDFQIISHEMDLYGHCRECGVR